MLSSLEGAVLEDDAYCEHCWSTLSIGISSKRQSTRLMEDGELFSEFEADRKAEELMRLMEDGEFSLEVDCETLLEDDA